LFGLEKGGEKVGEGASLFYLAMAVLCGTVYAFTYKRLFYLALHDNSNAVVFFLNRPSVNAFEGFIQTLKDKRKFFLLEKYGTLTKMISYEQQQQNILWLVNANALTHDEYVKKMAELNALFSSFPDITDFHLS
jgi:hypothetical protein